MTKRRGFSKAIDDLESAAGAASDIGSDMRERLEEELERIEDTIDKLKPHLDEIRGKLNDGYHETKNKAEHEIKKNPWAAVGIVAFVFLIIGFLLAGRRRD